MDPSAPSRTLLVSNRLPVTISMEKQRPRVVPSAGGLATGLRAPHERSGGLWFGWPGDVRRLKPEQRADLDAQLRAMRLVPIHLTPAEVERYYFGFSNSVLWPLFHYLLDQMPMDTSDWDEYVHVNERFAETVRQQYQEGDLIWVHDYQLMLLPQMLRQRLPAARIGFFLHIPFPSSEVFRILPWRTEVLQGLLGADLIGFHTVTYQRHFSMSLLRLLGLEADVNSIWHEGREVRLGVYPMGIDTESFEKLVASPEVRAEAQSLRKESKGAAIILCVDRLDYTKGITRRLLAFERLLEREPSRQGKVRLIQVAVPSRTEVPAYDAFKRQVDEIVGRINGRWTTARHVPIHYINRGLPQRELAALYLAADVMAVTPLRDGLNLVSKEFIACKPDLDGVLVLSEFAGAASELAEAILVNPYGLNQVASALSQALRMSPAERATRLQSMRDHVRRHDVHRWSNDFLTDLSAMSGATASTGTRFSSTTELKSVVERIRSAEHVTLFLDYDGTLVPFAPVPDLAAPDQQLIGLLQHLCARPGISVHIVSGRGYPSLGRWLDRIPATLHAEHGLWSHSPGDSEWHLNAAISDDWKPKVLPILERFVKCTPGSRIEEKSAGIVWHYRQAEPVFGALQAKELRLLLVELLSNLPVQVIAGEKVVEVRTQGIHKGGIVARVLHASGNGNLVVAIGDDRTDEDMFAALPEDGIAIHAGSQPSRARIRVPGPYAVRSLLSSLEP